MAKKKKPKPDKSITFSDIRSSIRGYRSGLVRIELVDGDDFLHEAYVSDVLLVYNAERKAYVLRLYGEVK